MASHLPRKGDPPGRSSALESSAGHLRRRLVNEKDAAAYLGVGVDFLKASRLTKPRCKGPEWVKIGRRVLYDVDVLDHWIEDHRVVSGL